MNPVHPATADELLALRWFERCGDELEPLLRNTQDVLCNWSILGVLPHGERFRVYLFERSSNALACVDGDGRSFGVVSSPSSPADWAEYLSRHDVQI